MNRTLAPDEQIRLDPRRMHSLTVGTPHRAWNGGDEAAAVAVQVVASRCPYELRLAA